MLTYIRATVTIAVDTKRTESADQIIARIIRDDDTINPADIRELSVDDLDYCYRTNFAPCPACGVWWRVPCENGHHAAHVGLGCAKHPSGI